MRASTYDHRVLYVHRFKSLYKRNLNGFKAESPRGSTTEQSRARARHLGAIVEFGARIGPILLLGSASSGNLLRFYIGETLFFAL